MSALPSVTPRRQWAVQHSDSHVAWRTWKMFVVPVHGRFTGWSGLVDIDLDTPSLSRVDVEIELASVDTGFGLMAAFGLREWHLRHGHYLGVSAFPMARFESDTVRVRGTDLEIEGILDLHGVRQPVTLAGKVVLDEARRRVFHATAVLDRYDFGITMGKLFEGFGAFVGNEITLDLRVALESIDADEVNDGQ